MKEFLKGAMVGALIGLITISTPIYADCSKPVQVIEQGQTAECKGFLFSPQAEHDAANDRDNMDYYVNMNEAYRARQKLQEDENQVLEQRLKLYMDSTTNLSKEVASRDNNSNLYNVVWFGLGVIATALVVRNVRQ